MLDFVATEPTSNDNFSTLSVFVLDSLDGDVKRVIVSESFLRQRSEAEFLQSIVGVGD